METEDFIKAEVRLFALESIVCQSVAALYQTMPREIFDAVKQQALGGARTQAFQGLDAAYSDVISAEFEAALERLYSMIEHHLDTVQRRQQK
jgi:hypothetical protein